MWHKWNLMFTWVIHFHGQVHHYVGFLSHTLQTLSFHSIKTNKQREVRQLDIINTLAFSNLINKCESNKQINSHFFPKNRLLKFIWKSSTWWQLKELCGHIEPARDLNMLIISFLRVNTMLLAHDRGDYPMEYSKNSRNRIEYIWKY